MGTNASLYTDVTQAKAKLCFSDKSKVDRPWRKFKDNVKKNKQCVKKDIDTVDWSVGSVTWKVKSPVPEATYHFRIFGMTAEGDYAMVYGDSVGYVKVAGYDGLEPGIVAGATVLSIIAWVILLGYFGYVMFVKSD